MKKRSGPKAVARLKKLAKSVGHKRSGELMTTSQLLKRIKLELVNAVSQVNARIDFLLERLS